MMKSYIYFLLVTASIAQYASEGTEGFFISPHGLNRQREVHDALEKVAAKMSIEDITYNHSGISYLANNFTLVFGYLDGRQSIDIIGNDQVEVSGGKIQVEYFFNFTKTQSGKQTKGYAYGSVISDSFNYTKMLTFGTDGHLIWCLSPNDTHYTNLTIFNLMRIKRIQPYNETDLKTLQDMLDKATTQIRPANLQRQILDKFNSIMPMILNTTLNSHILGPQIPYKFHHSTKGQLQMTIIHHLYGFGITPQDGYKVIFLTEIKDWPEPVCDNVTVPDKHLSWDFYGGSQNIHLICLYQEVVQFVQKKGWLDTRLDTSWDVNAFQFYAGDLYDMINNLHYNISARELVQGQCKSSPNNLSIKHGRDTRHNILVLSVTYTCTAKTRDRNLKYVDILNFSADVKFMIEPKAEAITLTYKVQDVDIVNMQFRPVGNYYVQNINLAMFKAKQVLGSMIGQNVFGTGFPTLARQHPGTEVTQNYVVYYDLSHKGSSKVNAQI